MDRWHLSTSAFVLHPQSRKRAASKALIPNVRKRLFGEGNRPSLFTVVKSLRAANPGKGSSSSRLPIKICKEMGLFGKCVLCAPLLSKSLSSLSLLLSSLICSKWAKQTVPGRSQSLKCAHTLSWKTDRTMSTSRVKEASLLAAFSLSLGVCWSCGLSGDDDVDDGVEQKCGSTSETRALWARTGCAAIAKLCAMMLYWRWLSLSMRGCVREERPYNTLVLVLCSKRVRYHITNILLSAFVLKFSLTVSLESRSMTLQLQSTAVHSRSIKLASSRARRCENTHWLC